MFGDRKPEVFLKWPGNQMHGNFSPNARLFAYTSNESGKYEVYARTVELTQRWPISTTGGSEPRWRSDGGEMYFLSEDKKLMAVSVGAGPSFGVPKPLFPTQVAKEVNALRTHYVPDRSGQRFLINTPIGNETPTPITVVLNWTAGLKK